MKNDVYSKTINFQHWLQNYLPREESLKMPWFNNQKFNQWVQSISHARTHSCEDFLVLWSGAFYTFDRFLRKYKAGKRYVSWEVLYNDIFGISEWTIIVRNTLNDSLISNDYVPIYNCRHYVSNEIRFLVDTDKDTGLPAFNDGIDQLMKIIDEEWKGFI